MERKTTLKIRDLLKKETLYDKLFKFTDDYEIYTHFLGFEPELGETIHSPIRAVDDYPSFALFIPTRIKTLRRVDEIWFKDLADGRFGDVIQFVKLYAHQNLDINLNSTYEIIKFIDSELELEIFNHNDKNYTRKLKARDFSYHKTTKDIYYKSRPFTKKDKNYWGKLELTTEDLEHFNVKSVRYLLNDNNQIRKEFSSNELAFVYNIYDKVKLYQPNAPKQFKFRNSCPGDNPYYYQGWEQLEGHDTLIITKSMKDLMVFWKFFKFILKTPVDVLAPHAESINLSDQFITAIKNTYKRIIVVSDYDLAGVKFANKLKKSGLEIKFVSTTRISINNKLKVLDKDISDFLSNHGKEKTKKLLESWNI